MSTSQAIDTATASTDNNAGQLDFLTDSEIAKILAQEF